MKYKNRLSELRGSTSQKEFAERIGLTQQNYWNYENGKQGLRADLIEKICYEFGCSPGWLLCFDEDDARLIGDELTPPTGYQGREIPEGALLPRLIPRQAYAPLLGRVHAGNAQEPEVIDDQIPVPYEVKNNHPRGYFLEVEGNCMSRVYPEGCHIYIDPEFPPSNGSIAVVSVDGADYVMRRLYRGANTIVLSPDSWDDEYADIVISDSDERTVELVGTVVWFQPAEEMV